MAIKTVFITTVGNTTFRVPADFVSLVSVEAIGGGGAGAVNAQAGGGGGGGAYAKSTTMTGAGLVANGTTYYSIGVAAQSWFNPTTNAAPTAGLSSGVTGVRAAAGGTGTTGNNGAGGTGGTVANSTGDLRYAGGNGGTGGPGPSSYGGAGGGAAGPGGAGGNGGNAFGTAPNSRNGGGGSGATLTLPGTNGVNGASGANGAGGASTGQTGGTAGGAAGGAGSNGGGGGGGLLSGGGGGGNGTFWTAVGGQTAGSGGGAGGSNALGGLYGGGDSATSTSSSGTQGIIVFTYNNTGFLSLEGDLEKLFVTDYAMIDQYAATGSLWTWGLNSNGQLGDNTTTSKSSPIQTISAGTNWKLVAGGFSHTAAIKTDGTLWTWGLNSNGQLGDNSRTHRSSPIQTVSGGTNWKLVAGGSNHTAAIKTDGTLWTWGLNTNGRLGDNTIASKSSPVQTVSGGTNWKQVAGGNSHTAVIKTDGTLWTWGFNTDGQLGDNSRTHRSSPIQTVSGGTNWKQVACGKNHTASIKTDGTLWLWGRNNGDDGEPIGQLGDNTTTSKSSPIQTVAGGTNWKLVACGDYHTACIKTDGTLWTWGLNTNGRLGDNTTTNRSSPVQTVAGGTNWKLVACGLYHTTAIKTDGTLWTWGLNTNGRLGDNTVAEKSSPVQTVAGGTNWKLVTGGNSHTAAIFFYEADKLYPPS